MADKKSNTGLELSTLCGDDYSIIRFISTDNTAYPSDKPQFEIRYKEFVGEEPYWSYTSHGAGYKGFGKVNNYAGTLSVSDDILSYTGLKNPLSITNTYNNVNYNEQANGYVHTHAFSGGYSHSSASGAGFKLSFNQIVYPISSSDDLYDEGYRYVYVDGDGTQHYFKTDGTKITDEDGLNFTLTENVGVITITDIKDNALTFTKPHGADETYTLSTSSDNNSNTVTFNYGINAGTADALINTIADAANRTTSVTYQPGSKLVSKITSSDGKEINFTYDSEKLKEVTYPDGLKTGYAYDKQGRLSGVWTDAGVGSSVGYSYASNDYESLNFFKIRSVTEYAGVNFDPKQKGRSTDFYYEMNQTKITNKINNSDAPYRENTAVFQFDHQGQVTAVLDSSGNMISNVYCSETDGRKHKIKHTNDSGRYTNNLLKNTSAGSDLSSWTVDNWLKSTADLSLLVTATTETEASLGTKCFKVSRSASSDAPWPIARQRVAIPKKSYDRKFTFSVDIKTNSALESGDGASLHIAAFSSDGQQMSGDEYSKWVTSTNGNWQRESVTVTVPANACEIECAFGVKESIGCAYFDCLQLEESDTSNDYNMVENSSFDSNLSSWTSSPDPSGTVVDGRLKIEGTPFSNKKVSQTIEVNKQNPVFAVRANSQGAAVPKGSSSLAKYQIECVLNFSDGTSQTVLVDFNPDVSDVQSVYKSIGPDTYGAGKTITSIVVSPCFDLNCNTVYFDNIQVCIDDGGTTYERNEKGSATKITDNLRNETIVNRDASSDEPTSIIDPRSNQVSNTYSPSKPHELADSTVETPSADVKTTLTHDSSGNVTGASLQKSDGTGKSIETGAEYTDSKNYLKKIFDARNGQTEFTTDENSGNITKIKNAKNVESNYTYDAENRLTSETCGALQNTYSYTKGILSEISHKVTNTARLAYKFARDMFGNISEVKVGEKVLSKSTHDAGNGLLRQTKYGNEQTVNFDYDSQGRAIKKSFGYGKTDKFGFVTYSYDSRDKLSETYDSVNNLTSKFEYDKYGRFVRVSRSDGTSSDINYTSLGSLIDKVTSKIFGITQTTENTFGKSNMLTISKITTNQNVIFSKHNYDTLGRVQSIDALNSDETSGIQHEITYLDAENSLAKTTNSVGAVELKKKVSGAWTSLGKKFGYAYDALGNITDIKDMSDSLIAHFDYDDLSELVRENNTETNKTVTYAYSEGGNLTEKKIYSYTTGDLTLETPENTITYNYEDSNWPDKLTSYTDRASTQNIIYDAIGNPLEYKGWELEWARGRRLDKMSNSGYNVNISFKYDENGIRTQKTVGDVQTDFVTSGIKVLAQKTGENTIIWQTDANGNTVGFNYNGAQYFYLKNAQGDIVGITDTSGEIVAEYKYDSWGKLISITDSNGTDKTTDASFIGCINPLRYRGYYYDSETSLYYLNARYYDPEVGRFINADDNLSDLNLFRYCANNPVNRTDLSGKIWWDTIKSLLGFSVKPYSGEANCYAYAVQFEVDSRTGKPFEEMPRPGEFSGNKLLYGDMGSNDIPTLKKG